MDEGAGRRIVNGTELNPHLLPPNMDAIDGNDPAAETNPLTVERREEGVRLRKQPVANPGRAPRDGIV